VTPTAGARQGTADADAGSREGAERYAELLSGLGAEVTVQLGSAGETISPKLLRSVFRHARRRADDLAAATELLGPGGGRRATGRRPGCG